MMSIVAIARPAPLTMQAMLPSRLIRWQAEAGLFVIVFSGIMTFILLKLVGIFVPLRLSDEELEIGDHAIHGNEVYPSDVPTLGGPHAPAWQPGGGTAVPAGTGA